MADSRLHIRVLDRRRVYRGRVFELIREQLQINGQRVVRETIWHPGSVVIVPVLDRSRVVLVRQYRRAVDRQLLELPAGTLGPRERPLACARRELAEETGCQARRLKRIGQFYAAPGLLSERMIVYVAEGLTPGRPHPEPDEWLTPVILPLRRALTYIRSGTICDAKSIIGLFWFAQRGLNP